MRIPDWLVYAVVLAAVGVTLLAHRERNDAPLTRTVAPAESPRADGSASSSVADGEDRRLNPPHPLDEKVLVQVGAAEDGVGTAFAINPSGIWLTARHVVDGCSKVAIARGDGALVAVDGIRTSRTSDLALLLTDRAPSTVTVDFDRELSVGESGYHVGFPQGHIGEARSELLSRSRLVTRGRYDLDEPVLAWVERGRSGAADGSLAGMSGGPVFDSYGLVVGVTVAESPRRGRIYTATPDSVRGFLEEQGVVAMGAQPGAYSAFAVSGRPNGSRLDLSVVKVVCRVGVT